MNAKKKGNAGENNFANWMQSKGFKVYKNGSSGGNAWKSDCHNDLDFNFEVKTVKKLNLQEAWKQTTRDAGLAHTTPSLEIHFDGMGKDEWLIVMHSEDWIELLQRANEAKITPTKGETTKNWLKSRAAENLARSIKEAEKQGVFDF